MILRVADVYEKRSERFSVMSLYLMLGSGVFWTLTYILIIIRSIRDRSYGMPMIALCANISWEFIFSFVFPSHGIQRFVNIIWFALDFIILILFLRFGRKEFASLSRFVFLTMFGLALVTSFCTVMLATIDFHDGGTYSAFGQNLMMSVLFIAMLYQRRSLRGQSVGIALSKCIGTLLASGAFYLYMPISHHSALLPFLYLATFFYDIVYIGMVLMQKRGVIPAFLVAGTKNKYAEM
jgi:hypothetical protein